MLPYGASVAPPAPASTPAGRQHGSAGGQPGPTLDAPMSPAPNAPFHLATQSAIDRAMPPSPVPYGPTANGAYGASSCGTVTPSLVPAAAAQGNNSAASGVQQSVVGGCVYYGAGPPNGPPSPTDPAAQCPPPWSAAQAGHATSASHTVKLRRASGPPHAVKCSHSLGPRLGRQIASARTHTPLRTLIRHSRW